MSTLFLAGGFGDPRLVAALFGRALAARPARLPGWKAGEAGAWYLRLARAPGSMVEGAVVSLETRDDAARLRFFCKVFGFHNVPGMIEGTAERVRVLVQAAPALAARPPEGIGPGFAAAALAELMEARSDGAGHAARFWPQILQRHASRERAGREALPAGVRTGGGTIETLARRTPYRAFFTVAEADLRFPRFEGGFSAPVARAAFCMADAVTVLPYDPRRDRVMVVEQFRFGPHMRGDPRPWSVEPIAGRIDAGETPEDAVRREAREEAGLTLDRLLPIGRYYPSPGAVTEYIYSYLAPCDLPDGIAGVGGLEAEAEDIRAILLGFDRLMALLAEGLLENGPLLVSALQLARRRADLRGGG